MLVKDIKLSVLKRHLKQISDAYSRISFTSLCEMLILDARQTVEGNRLILMLLWVHIDIVSNIGINSFQKMFSTACQKLNWEIEGDNEYVLPKPISASGPEEGERTFEKGRIVTIDPFYCIKQLLIFYPHFCRYGNIAAAFSIRSQFREEIF